MFRPQHVYALFNDKDAAVAAYHELQRQGCPGDRCSALMHEGVVEADDLGTIESASREGARRGALISGTTGLALGGLVGLSGGVLGVGFLAGLAIGGGILAAYGALFGAITASDDPERHVRALERELADGAILIAVKADEAALARMSQEVLMRNGGRAITV